MAALKRLLPAAAIWLAACSGSSSGNSPGPATPSSAENGAKIYAQSCVPCHRDDGAGIPNVYPSLANSAVVNGDPVQLAKWVLSGQRPRAMPVGRYSTQMLLFGWLKDDDAAALLTYVRSHFGNASAPVDAATIAKSREQ
jgi:mono/diheme cytochrome c family protein